MEVTTLCAVVAALRVLPDRSQFFQYESVTVSCEQQGNCSEWKVKRNLFLYPNSECSTSWDATNGSVCSIPDLYPADTGAYWCESAAGERSDAVNITVTHGDVILDGPVLPVSEGEAVTLSCRHRAPSSSAPTAHFYKDGVLVGNSSTANMTLHRVSRSDQGLYSCHMFGAGSPGSWLTVTAEREDPPPAPLPAIGALLPVVVTCLVLGSLVCLMLLCLWRSRKGEDDPDVPYTDVIVTQDTIPRRLTDLTRVPTCYTAVKPETT